MKHTLNSISNRMVALFSMIFKLAQKQADYKTMTRHIIALGKKQSSTQIINEVAVCLKNILNYRLFAFVIKKKNGVDVWLDPKMYKNSLEKIILKDFSLENSDSLNYLTRDFNSDDSDVKFNIKDMIFYEFVEEDCYARVYMLPDNNLISFNGDLVDLILQGASTALSRLFSIEKLKKAALIDPLTGCYNRREFTNQLNKNMAGAVRKHNSLSLFIFDLDHFKRINDTYGHLAGDKVLQEISSLVQKNMRTNDIFARYGGEEFIAILPDTDKTRAIELADRLRVKIAKQTINFNGDTIKISASFGVTQMQNGTSMEKFIHDADTMLYKAKFNGRNIVMPGLIKVVENKNMDKKQAMHNN